MFSIRARRGMLWPAVCLLAILLIVSNALDVVGVGLVTTAMIYAIGAVSVDLLGGYSGQFSFGQFAYYATGAYGMVTFIHYGHLTPLLAILAAIACSGLLAGLVAAATVRLRLFGAALGTFFFAAVISELAVGQSLVSITGGDTGVSVPPVVIGGINLDNSANLYYVSWGALALCVLIALRYLSCRAGRSLLVIKRSEVVAAALGVAVYREKVRAQVVCGMMAGLAGCLYALSIGYLSGESFAATVSVTLFAMAAVGGLGTIVGPIIGSVVYVVLNHELTVASDKVSQVAFAAAFLLVVMFFEDGIWGLGERLVRPVIRRVPVLAGHRVGATSAWPWHRSNAAEGSLPGELIDLADGEVARARAAAPDAPVVLGVSGIDVRFGEVKALTAVGLTVRRGEIVAIVGPNGAGKTTLLDCISGIRVPNAGAVQLVDDDVSTRGIAYRYEHGLARTFQHTAVVPDLDVLENVRLGAYGSRSQHLGTEMAGVGPGRRISLAALGAALGALREIEFPHDRVRISAGELTMGEQKRLDIARALASKPSVLLLDEPTAGLSESELAPVGAALTSARARGVGVLAVVHHISFVREIADRVIVMNFGEVIASGATEEVFELEHVQRVLMGGGEGVLK